MKIRNILLLVLLIFSAFAFIVGKSLDSFEGFDLKKLQKTIVDFHLASAETYADAQYSFAERCQNGDGVPADKSQAIEWYRKAAEQGHVEAQCRLAVCCYNGKGTPVDKFKAFEWFHKAAERGYADAQYCSGVCYDNGDGVPADKFKAFEWFHKAAEQGHARAQFNLGRCYEYGSGVPADKFKAFEWFRKAAEQGHVEAQFNLGNCYADGDGVPVDKSKAFDWYQKSANQGHAKAQCCLGACYDNGDGVPADKFKAIEWYRKAAKQGHTKAQENLMRCLFFETLPVPCKDWRIGKYEVTQAEYEKIMGENPSCFKGDNLPVENVSWNDAVAFCEKLTKFSREAGVIKNKQFYRLPTAEEWEYACRAGTKTKYCSGDTKEDLSRVAWWSVNSSDKTHPVGTKEPNAWGIYDMHGNVGEWCQNLRDSNRVNCGGGYFSYADYCESSSILSYYPDYRYNYLGFRIVLDIEEGLIFGAVKSIFCLPKTLPVPCKDWRIGKYEVTQAEYKEIMGENPSHFKGDNLPVENVSWDDAVAFCEKLTEYARKRGLIENDQSYRLPTAEEWKYACRAGTTTKYCSGNSEEDLSRVAWWKCNSDDKTHPVGTREPNAWGIYDMHGNVWEWCQDSRDPNRVYSGGGYNNSVGSCESSLVGRFSPGDLRSSSLGFRVVLAPTGQ